MLQAFDQPLPEGIVLAKNEPDIVAFKGENIAGGRLRLRPGLAFYFNDPSGAFRYDVLLDTTNLTIAAQVEKILMLAKNRGLSAG